MNDSVRNLLRKMGEDGPLERERTKWRQRAEETASGREDIDRSEVEKKHDQFRRQQELASRLGPAAERLPILTPEEQAERAKGKPKRKKLEFEGPIEKLIEKYGDPEEVFKHLSLGQHMKYELKDGKIFEKGKLIFDGEKMVNDD